MARCFFPVHFRLLSPLTQMLNTFHFYVVGCLVLSLLVARHRAAPSWWSSRWRWLSCTPCWRSYCFPGCCINMCAHGKERGTHGAGPFGIRSCREWYVPLRWQMPWPRVAPQHLRSNRQSDPQKRFTLIDKPRAICYSPPPVIYCPKITTSQALRWYR